MAGLEHWRDMDRDALDLAYNNALAVPQSAAILADWRERSAALRLRHPEHLDLPYGPCPRNRLDLFLCGVSNAPLLVFIHGGYWQRNAKEGFSCMAEGVLASGCDVAMLGYTLCPEVTLGGIVSEIDAGISWLRREGPALGIARERLIVSGWSAGGHLAACIMGRGDVDAGLAISGVFDVEPCRLNYLNEALRLSEADARDFSPLHHPPAEAGPLIVAYGTEELPELQRQSEAYIQAWNARGLAVEPMPLEGHDHFSILEELSRPGGRLAKAVLKLAGC